MLFFAPTGAVADGMIYPTEPAAVKLCGTLKLMSFFHPSKEKYVRAPVLKLPHRIKVAADDVGEEAELDALQLIFQGERDHQGAAVGP